jgi:2-oxoglutarate ferredoxin oxidoreductase subunit beta
MKSKTTPWGVIETPFNPIAYAILGGATFVARGFSGDVAHLKEIFKQAIEHQGFAFVDVFQPCVTFNKLNTYDWFRQRVYKLEDTKHKTQNREAAMEKAMEDMRSNYKKVPIGVFYKEKAPTYEDQLPQIKDKPLVKQSLKVDLKKAYEELM